MSLPQYEILVDGLGYAGESGEAEELPPGLSSGWSSDRPRECAGIRLGEPPLRIEGVRNLRSHVERIVRRIEGVREIVIRRVDPDPDGREEP